MFLAPYSVDVVGAEDAEDAEDGVDGVNGAAERAVIAWCLLVAHSSPESCKIS